MGAIRERYPARRDPRRGVRGAPGARARAGRARRGAATARRGAGGAGRRRGVAGARVGRTWIVDPLDGTMNYANGIPYFCVSVGLVVDGRPGRRVPSATRCAARRSGRPPTGPAHARRPRGPRLGQGQADRLRGLAGARRPGGRDAGARGAAGGAGVTQHGIGGAGARLRRERPVRRVPPVRRHVRVGRGGGRADRGARRRGRDRCGGRAVVRRRQGDPRVRDRRGAAGAPRGAAPAVARGAAAAGSSQSGGRVRQPPVPPGTAPRVRASSPPAVRAVAQAAEAPLVAERRPACRGRRPAIGARRRRAGGSARRRRSCAGGRGRGTGAPRPCGRAAWRRGPAAPRRPGDVPVAAVRAGSPRGCP